MVLVHDVLKWLHHPLLKYVILLHSASARHRLLHSSTLETLPGELSWYTSPALVSHTALWTCSCTQRMAAPMLGVVSDITVKCSAIALLSLFVLVHSVL